MLHADALSSKEIEVDFSQENILKQASLLLLNARHGGALNLDNVMPLHHHILLLGSVGLIRTVAYIVGQYMEQYFAGSTTNLLTLYI